VTVDLRGRSLLKEVDFTKEEFTYLIDLAEQLRDEKASRSEVRRLVGLNIALIFEKSSTRTRSPLRSGRTTRVRTSPTSARRSPSSDTRSR